MDYKEEIKKAAEQVTDNTAAFVAGALSQVARDYWYNEFKLGDGILEQTNHVPIHKLPNGCPDIKYLIDNSWYKYCDYIKNNPDRPISFDNWKYMVEHYPTESWIDLADEYLKYKFIHIDCKLSFEEWKNIISKPQVEKGKRSIGIIGHVNHGSFIFTNNANNIILLKNRRGGQTIMNNELPKIESIVPIADVIPEQIISKQEFLKMHDKAVESSITDETYKESRSWDIKKEKKVSHKRTNKRK